MPKISKTGTSSLYIFFHKKEQKFNLFQQLISTIHTAEKLDSTLFSKEKIADYYSNYAFYQLINKDFKSAEESTKKGILYNQKDKNLYLNLAPSLLLQGKYEEAEAVYLKLKDNLFSEKTTFEEAFLANFKLFEREGIIPTEHRAEVEKIKKMLRE